MSAGITANNDGSAAITVGGNGYIEIAANGVVDIPVGLTVAGQPVTGGGVTDPYVLNAYTSPGNWGPVSSKPGLKSIKVTVVGGGGTGGTGATPASGASGGGAGGAAIRIYPAPSLPTSAVPYTVAAPAGTSSFGVAPLIVITATGGGNGAPQSPGGAGGAGSNGNINFEGGAGAQSSTNGQNPGSTGGNSIFGGGGRGAPAPAATTWGAGGGGGQAAGQSAPAGLAGAPGVVIVEEFY
jgi:hypothetical protein